MPRASCCSVRRWTQRAKTMRLQPLSGCFASAACRLPSVPTTACPLPVPMPCFTSPSCRCGGSARHCDRAYQAGPSATKRPPRAHAPAPQEGGDSPARLQQPAAAGPLRWLCSRVQRGASARGTRHEVPCRTLHRLTALLRRPARTELSVPRPRRHRRRCGRLCLHRKRINISTVLAGQKLGIKEVDEGIWLVSFMHYDLGYFDLEQKTLQPLDNPFGTRLSPMS
jgi:hypothetical protein